MTSMTWIAIIWLIVFILTVITLISFIWVIAPYFPTRSKHLEAINKICALKPGEIFYELGCGDARVSRHLAKHNPEAQIIALEMAVILFLIAKIKSLRYPNLTVKWQNIFWEDLSKADGVYVFGMTDSLNKKLRAKFLEELKPKSRIISYVFSMKDWEGKSEDFPQPGEKTVIHRYTMK